MRCSFWGGGGRKRRQPPLFFTPGPDLVLTITSDVVGVPQGQGAPDHQDYPSVVRSITGHVAFEEKRAGVTWHWAWAFGGASHLW